MLLLTSGLIEQLVVDWFANGQYEMALRKLHSHLRNPFLREYFRRVSLGEIIRDERQVNCLKLFPTPTDNGTSAFSGEECGIYLWGGVGTGKSMLLDLLHSKLPLKKKRWEHFHAFMLDVHRRMHRQRQIDAGDPVPAVATSIACETQALFLDEFQVADPADAIILRRLFSAMLDQGIWVATSSNTAPSNLYEEGINRPAFLPFIDLVHDKLRVHQIDGHICEGVAASRDYRQTMGPVEPGTYVYPLGDKADRALEDTFCRVTGVGLSNAERKKVAVMMGRHLKPAPLAVGGVAFVDFDDLCKGNTGAADFLALAGAFHTVFLRGVPALDPSQPEAARFVNFLDVMYERGRHIVLSAALPPAELLRLAPHDDALNATDNVRLVGEGGASGRFATTMVGNVEWSATGRAGASLAEFSNARQHVAHSFRRAASRLEEMRSRRYWRRRSSE